jgi:CheY-like chemotaxis protein
VLLVDDEQQVRDLFQEVLEEAGFQVLPAGSGEAALVLAADRPAPVDLLITDVIMPGMSGFELIAALRASQPGLRTMVLTGYPEQQSPDGAAPDAYLTKPIKPSALVHEVRAALAR